MRSLYYKKKKNRLREIEFSKLEEMKEAFAFRWKDVAELLNVSEAQVINYKRCGRLPADRYYAMKDALLLDCEDELRERRQQIIEMFS